VTGAVSRRRSRRRVRRQGETATSARGDDAIDVDRRYRPEERVHLGPVQRRVQTPPDDPDPDSNSDDDATTTIATTIVTRRGRIRLEIEVGEVERRVGRVVREQIHDLRIVRRLAEHPVREEGVVPHASVGR